MKEENKKAAFIPCGDSWEKMDDEILKELLAGAELPENDIAKDETMPGFPSSV